MSVLVKPSWIEPREYQQLAVDAWFESGGQGIFHMATGTGKTITALLCAAELSKHSEEKLAVIVAVPYQHLVEQWKSEMTNFGGTPFLAYRSRHLWLDSVAGAINEFTFGVRTSLQIITTHATFSSDHFQELLGRLDGYQTLLIADEVHHLGAPHLRKSLNPSIYARLGLSATPERWYDKEGTDALMAYFSKGVIFEYGLGTAIENGHLSKYYYIPHVIRLTEEEEDSYLSLSLSIASILANESEHSSVDFTESDRLRHLLLKRARLTGTAQNKSKILFGLIDEIGSSHIHHSLVYCGDGSVNTEGDEVKRQLRRVTEMLGHELGIRAHQFTYEEDQPTRTRLLTEFETGRLQALVAIRCLDEGVDVPATNTAFILASSTNPRQFVQRRGRILRPHEDKEYAIIHDFIVAPPDNIINHDDPTVFSIERNMIKKELARVGLFVEHAINHPTAELSGLPNPRGSITELKQNYNLLDM